MKYRSLQAVGWASLCLTLLAQAAVAEIPAMPSKAEEPKIAKTPAPPTSVKLYTTRDLKPSEIAQTSYKQCLHMTNSDGGPETTDSAYYYFGCLNRTMSMQSKQTYRWFNRYRDRLSSDDRRVMDEACSTKPVKGSGTDLKEIPVTAWLGCQVEALQAYKKRLLTTNDQPDDKLAEKQLNQLDLALGDLRAAYHHQVDLALFTHTCLKALRKEMRMLKQTPTKTVSSTEIDGVCAFELYSGRDWKTISFGEERVAEEKTIFTRLVLPSLDELNQGRKVGTYLYNEKVRPVDEETLKKILSHPAGTATKPAPGAKGPGSAGQKGE